MPKTWNKRRIHTQILSTRVEPDLRASIEAHAEILTRALQQAVGSMEPKAGVGAAVRDLLRRGLANCPPEPQLGWIEGYFAGLAEIRQRMNQRP